MAQEFFKYEGRCGKGFQRLLKEERRADAVDLKKIEAEKLHILKGIRRGV